jgi:hypothetical protein
MGEREWLRERKILNALQEPFKTLRGGKGRACCFGLFQDPKGGSTLAGGPFKALRGGWGRAQHVLGGIQNPEGWVGKA